MAGRVFKTHVLRGFCAPHSGHNNDGLDKNLYHYFIFILTFLVKKMPYGGVSYFVALSLPMVV
jgi:hypothetical protein